MRTVRLLLPFFAALILLGLAFAFAVLALDVRGWQSTLARDDIGFRARPSLVTLWESPATIPWDPARAVLGLGDALAYRRALQRYWFEQVGTQQAKGVDLTVARAVTQTELQELTTGASSATERSTAANLLGIMTVRSRTTTSGELAKALERAASYFRLAIADDPANWTAKANLELLLRLKKPAKSHFGADARSGFGFGGLQGRGVVGGGY